MSQCKRRRRRFLQLADRYVYEVKRLASELCRGDRDLADDLLQEGLICLWRLDDDDIQRARNPRDFVQRCLYNAMIEWTRREGRWIRSADNHISHLVLWADT